MNSFTARRLAWSIGIVSILLMLGTIVLNIVDRAEPLPDTVGGRGIPRVIDVVVSLGVTAIGMLITARRPKNVIGWLFIVAGLALALAGFGAAYAIHVLAVDPGALPGGRLMALISTSVQSIPIGLLLFLFLLFPDGHLPSRRWRPVAWLTAADLAVLTAASVAFGVASWSFPFAPIDEPVGGGVREVAVWIFLVAVVIFTVAMVLAFVSVAVRFSRSSGEERLQLKWFVSAAALVAVSAIVGVFYDAPITDVAFSVCLLLLMGAIAVSILRYRLYEIDIIIGKAIVYALLGGFITVIYVLFVVVIGVAIGVTEGLTLIATAVAAIAFQPARERAQRVANRIVYGERATPYEVLSEFSEHLGEAYGGDDVLVRMAKLLAEGTGATNAVVWLKVGPEVRPAARWPTDADVPSPVRLSRGDALELDDLTESMAVRHHAELLGFLSVRKPPKDPLSPVESKLMTDLAGQAGLVLANRRLIEDLRASRQRLVAAQDEERRRIERNLHDGAQQQLVALAVRLKLARSTASRDLAEADAQLEQLERDVADALENLRDLARGIYPPLLADKGLAAAIEAQSRRAAVPVHLEIDGIRRYPQEIEAAVYFCTLEALQNAAKYAEPNEVAVQLHEQEGDLVFTVRDDGRGFDRATTPLGTGLQSMADRLAALEGTLEIRSKPGSGTIVTGRLPVPHAAAPTGHQDRAPT